MNEITTKDADNGPRTPQEETTEEHSPARHAASPQAGGQRYWLMKSEPTDFSIRDLAKRPGQREPWDGVRNYQARNMLRDQMKEGDLAFFYHSNCAYPGIVGIIRIVREGYPDDTAFDFKSKHFDPKSDPGKPRWYRVDVELARIFPRAALLHELKQYPELADMPLVRRNNRLSVMPVRTDEWAFILSLVGLDPEDWH